MGEAGSKQEVKLPATSYAVLGMLTFGEMSGYDVAKAVARSVGFFWTSAKSQVYSELRRLQEVGYATEREVAQTDRPDKRLYTITSEGLQALRIWLEHEPVELEPTKSTFLLKVFFGHIMAPDAVVDQVLEYRRQMEALLARFEEIDRHIAEAEHASRDILVYQRSTLKYGMSYARAAIAWCDETSVELRKEARKGGKR